MLFVERNHFPDAFINYLDFLFSCLLAICLHTRPNNHCTDNDTKRVKKQQLMQDESTGSVYLQGETWNCPIP